jgi:predicted deacylase
VKRRAFLAGGAAAAAAVGGVSPLGGRADVTAPEREPVDRLLPGTDHETPVYALGSGSGPTGLVVAGVHGDERSGYLAAERILEWDLRAGRLVVLPRANRVAIDRGTRHGEGGDLNRQFPPGETPTTDLARAVWNLVERVDPDVVTNLHSSTGLYRRHAEFVGQALFPTAAGDAVAVARETVGVLNDAVVPWYMPLHDYRLGNVLRGTAPLLAHKVGGDLGRPAYIVETTEFLLDPRAGARWTERAATEVLARHGIARRGTR